MKFSVNVTRENCHLKALFLDNNRITDDVYHAFVKALASREY